MQISLLFKLLPSIDLAMAAVAWLIYFCTYPDFARWRSENFREHHQSYTSRVGWVVGPLLLLQIVGHFLVWRNGAAVTGFVLVVLTWVFTAICSIPAHRRLQQEGYNLEVINHLTRTHIVRTLLWSGLAIYSLRNAVG